MRVLLRNIYNKFKSAVRSPCSHHERNSLCVPLCPQVRRAGQCQSWLWSLGGLVDMGGGTWERCLGTAGDGEVSTPTFSPAHPHVCHRGGSLRGPAVGQLHGKSWESGTQNLLAAALRTWTPQAPRAGRLLASRVRDRGSEEGACCQQPLWTQDVSLITSRWIRRNCSHLRRKKKKKHVSCRINEIRMAEAGQPGGEAHCQDHGYV